MDVVVVKDPEVRRRMRDLYLPGWYDYLASNGGPPGTADSVDDSKKARRSRGQVERSRARRGKKGVDANRKKRRCSLRIFADLGGA